MYVTKTERELARSLAFLRLAQDGLASARRLGCRDLIAQAEQHVLRNLTYVGNAQDAVLRQRKRDPGSIFAHITDVPVGLEVV